MARFFTLFALAGLVVAGCNQPSDKKVSDRGTGGSEKTADAPPKPAGTSDAGKDAAPKAATGGAATTDETPPSTPTAEKSAKPDADSTTATEPAKNADADQTGDSIAADDQPEELSIDALLARAMSAGQQGDLDGAERDVAAVIARDPKHPQGLAMSTSVSLAKGHQLVQGAAGNEDQIKAAHEQFIAAAGHFRTLREVDPVTAKRLGQLGGMALYNAACGLAQKGETAEAIAALKEAYDGGMSDLEMLDSDADLASLRELPEFVALKAELAKKLAEAAREHAQELLAQGETFPFDFELTSVDDTQALKLTDLKGKVVIVDIWGTWCPPCRKEIPHFIALVEKYRDQGLNVIGINYENGDPEAAKENVKQFIADNKMNYPCALGDEATQAQVPNFEGFPTTMFVDRAGKVRLKAVGYHDYATLAAIVETLLAENADGAGQAGNQPAAATEAASPAGDAAADDVPPPEQQ